MTKDEREGGRGERKRRRERGSVGGSKGEKEVRKGERRR